MCFRKSIVFHSIHVVIFTIYGALIIFGLYWWKIHQNENPFCNPWKVHSYLYNIIYYMSRLNLLLAVPQSIVYVCGLVFLNAFKEADLAQCQVCPNVKEKLKVCIRAVTRGDYPDLINFTLKYNLDVCQKVHECFVFELLTEKMIKLDPSIEMKIVQTVVPEDYKCKNGTLFKARNWQYALKKNALNLKNDDWIVHLDEDTLMTKSSAIGILKFIDENKYDVGHGLVTYLKTAKYNFLTYAVECPVVGEHLGLIRGSLTFFSTPYFYVKGSFIATRQEVEANVQFDHGIDSCVSEDYHFALLSSQMRYRWGYIDGVMHEQSNGTIAAYLRQRRRWLYGTFRLLFFAPQIKFDFLKVAGFFRLFVWTTIPLGVMGGYLTSCELITTMLGLSVLSIFFYGQIFGAVKSAMLMPFGITGLKLASLTVASMLTSPLCVSLDGLCVLFTLIKPPKLTFKVTQKFNYGKKAPSDTEIMKDLL